MFRKLWHCGSLSQFGYCWFTIWSRSRELCQERLMFRKLWHCGSVKWSKRKSYTVEKDSVSELQQFLESACSMPLMCLCVCLSGKDSQRKQCGEIIHRFLLTCTGFMEYLPQDHSQVFSCWAGVSMLRVIPLYATYFVWDHCDIY